MSSDKPTRATPGQAKASSGSFEQIFPEGSIIDLRDEESTPMCCLILQGQVAAEILDGSVLIDILRQDEAFNEQYAFSDFRGENKTTYRALTKCAIRGFDRKTVVAGENQPSVRELYRAIMRTRIRQSIDIPRNLSRTILGMRREYIELEAEKNQELAATIEQMESVKSSLEAARASSFSLTRELQDYKNLTSTLEERMTSRAHELTSKASEETQKAEEALQQIKAHQRKIALALERISRNNPELVLDATTLSLLVGEDPPNMTQPPPRNQVEDEDDFDKVFSEAASEAETKPSHTLIPESGVPSSTLRPRVADGWQRQQPIVAPPSSKRQPPPLATKHPALPLPLPRGEDEGYEDVDDEELASIRPAPPLPLVRPANIGQTKISAAQPAEDLRTTKPQFSAFNLADLRKQAQLINQPGPIPQQRTKPIDQLDSVPPPPPSSPLYRAPIQQGPFETTRAMDLSAFRQQAAEEDCEAENLEADLDDTSWADRDSQVTGQLDDWKTKK